MNLDYMNKFQNIKKNEVLLLYHDDKIYFLSIIRFSSQPIVDKELKKL